MTNDLFNTDCLDYMKSLPGKSFDLSIADPPFGVSYARGKNGWGVCDNRPSLDDVKWDSKIPDKEFFDELLRVSENVIIWGVIITLIYCQCRNAGLCGTSATERRTRACSQMRNWLGLT